MTATIAVDKKLLIIFIYLSVYNVYGQTKTSTIETKIDSCTAQETCASCLRMENCVWCGESINPSDPRSNSLTRCVSREWMKMNSKNWCKIDETVIIESEMNITRDLPFSSEKGNQIQVTPQRVKMRLRLGDEMGLTVKYKQAEDYPVDLYFLMDLSASMEHHRNHLSTLGLKLADAMRNLTSNFNLGFGSFVDKVVLPMTSTQEEWSHGSCTLSDKTPCASPYGYKNQMPLTPNITAFKTFVMDAPISGNIDLPEGGLDALMQVMVCWKEIGWRDNARHLLVYSSDAKYHIAGDGRLAGIVEPNDEQCHLNKTGFYTHAELLDYPSLAQIKVKALDNNINIIFAVTDVVLNEYKDLSTYLTTSSIGKLDRDSRNVVQLVSDEYQKLTNKIIMTHNATGQFVVRTSTNCGNPSRKLETKSECGEVRVDKILEFNYLIKAVKCPEREEDWKQFIEIKPEGVNEKVIVEIDLVCDCPCSKPGRPGFKADSVECSEHGDFTCGVCSCKDGYFGKVCDCKGDRKVDQSRNSKEACRRTNETEECSGRGRCECDACRCNPRPNPNEYYYGKFCQCDNFSCDQSFGMVCGGPERGTCECGTCNCNAGLTGRACDCSTSVATCMPPGDNPKECNGFGKCICGECKCNTSEGRSGEFCEDCSTCPSQHCGELKDCVECLVHGSGLKYEEDPECKICKKTIDIEELVQEIDETVSDGKYHKCTIPVDAGCSFTFIYSNPIRGDTSNSRAVTAEKNKRCSSPRVSAFGVAGAAIGLTLFLGLLGLLAWKVLTMIHDHREFVKFEKERIGARYQGGTNPIFKEPTSTFQNPMFETQQNTA